MHWSIIPERAGALHDGLPDPPCPIFDIHMHSGSVGATAAYVRAAGEYGITEAVNMEFSEMPGAMADEFLEFTFHPCAWPRLDKGLDWDAFKRKWIVGFDRWLERGMKALKFKSEPRNALRPGWWLDDERIAPLLDLCAQHGILVQAHIAQPTPWWPDKFPPHTSGEKQEYLDQVERMLRQHPDLKYLGVHMGGNPEDLDYLSRMMERYPNYHIDTSATKWVVREMSAKRDAAREFFIHYQERICFGSDLVVQEGIDYDYYQSRFYVQRMMWESEGRSLSMIADPDAPEDGPYINGLNLPLDVLNKLYRGNAERLLT